MMNQIQSKLKSQLFQSTQNLKFNILINANAHKISNNQVNTKGFYQSNNKKVIESTLIPLTSFIDHKQMKIEDKISDIKKKSLSQKKMATHSNLALQKQMDSGLKKSSHIRKRLLSASSFTKINTINTGLPAERPPIKIKERVSESKDQSKIKVINPNRGDTLSKINQNGKSNFFLQPISINLQQKKTTSKLKLITPTKLQMTTPFTLQPSVSKQTLQSKLKSLGKNFQSQVSQLLPLQSQRKKSTFQDKKALASAMMETLNSSFTLYVKNGILLKQNSDYRLFIQKLANQLQNNLFTAQNILSHMERIEQFVYRYQVSSSINSSKVQSLQHYRVVSNWQILNLFSDWKKIIKESKNIHKKIIGLLFYYPNLQKGREIAANKIIHFFRLIRDKNYAKKMASLMAKVKKIQRYWRRALLVKRHRQKVIQNAERKLTQFSKTQQKFIAKYQLIKTSRKVEIHISSLAFQQFKRVTLESKNHYQNTQISRIFKALQNPDTFLIYVTPFQLSQSIIKYYQRLFKIATGSDIALKQKVYFVYPEITQRINNFCQLSTLSYLLYSPKALKRIKLLIKSISSTQNSYIVPSFPSIQYVGLSNELKVPIFSSSPSLCKLYSTKIGFRQLIQPVIDKQKSNPPFRLLKSVSSIYSEKELINSLALLIYKNQQIKRWYFKIDDQFNSRGLAYFNVNSINFLRKLNESGNEDVVGDLVQNEKQIVKIIVTQLKEKLKQRLKIINKQVYPTYNQFITHFLTRGGVVEASLQFNHSQTKQLSIAFLIEPNGDFQIMSSFRKLELNSKSICNTVEYPAKNSKNVDVQKIVRHLYRRLYLKLKLFGYFTIDLLIENKDDQKTTPYVIGMSCFLTIQSGALFMLQQLAKVRYDKDKNSFQKISINSNEVETSSLSSSKISRVQFEQEQKSLTGDYLTKKQSLFQKQNQKSKKGQISLIFCPMISLPNLQPMAEFFKKCKYQNIAFDLKTLYGTIFLPLDQLQCEKIGFIVCQQGQIKMAGQMTRVVEFLSKNYRKRKQIKEKSRKQQDEVGMLRGVILSQIHKSEEYKKQQKLVLAQRNCQATFNNLDFF